MYIFLTQFLPQLPIMHTASLRVELKPPILLKAMQACGAIFVKTKTAEAFVEKVLANSRDTLVSEFVSPLLCAKMIEHTAHSHPHLILRLDSRRHRLILSTDCISS